MKKTVKSKAKNRGLLVSVEKVRKLSDDKLEAVAGGQCPTGTGGGCYPYSCRLNTVTTW